MADAKRIDAPTGTETVGHEWDGIEELNTPLPRWWLWTFILTVIWGIAYTIFYPAWPMINSATTGTFGWSSRGQLQQELSAENARRAPFIRAISTMPLDQVASDQRLLPVAMAGGAAAFRAHCVQCHGSGATGSAGYPNLRDDDWLWGGNIDAIYTTLRDGIRNPDHAQTRMSLMPAFGRDGILDAGTVQDVVSHVRVISRQEQPSAASQRGAVAFAANCAVCHGDGGAGNRTLGAPNLTDAIWLYGGSRDALTQSINNSRKGVMPRWGNVLDDATIRMLAVYVHSLGGGEAASPATPAPVAELSSPAAAPAGPAQ
ncbi:MAG: cytochrome-c oxidase, cbb3-type subunit III [Sphingopyxis sp.]|nr:cytochrome-c oxidase, cbb3-type subunit III [Sphingopyxis sp.]